MSERTCLIGPGRGDMSFRPCQRAGSRSEALDARAQQRQDGVAGGGEAFADGQAGAVALMDALGDHRQFKKAEGDVKIELTELAAGLPRIALDQQLRRGE